MSATILIVDDEPAQLELLRYNLEKAGFKTVHADNGREAIDLVEDKNPDLVVLDWMMPEASGIDVCRELRARSESRLLPIIMLSARGEDGDRALEVSSLDHLHGEQRAQDPSQARERVPDAHRRRARRRPLRLRRVHVQDGERGERETAGREQREGLRGGGHGGVREQGQGEDAVER